MSYSIPDWSSILGFVWAIGASWLAWRQSDKRRQDADTALAFLHGLKPAIQGPNQQAILEQIHDQMARIQPPILSAELASYRRWKAVGGVGTIAGLGAVAGLGLTLCAVNLWPRDRVVPSLLTVNSLRIGVDEDGQSALCDADGKAYDVGVGRGPELIARRMHGDPPVVIDGKPALRPLRQATCRPA